MLTFFCGVNPRHGNIGRAMSTHSQAPDSKNTSCCPECHLTCSRRAKTQASGERKKETRRRFNGCFFGPCMVAAVIRTNSWQATITNPRSSYGCRNGGQSSATQLICRMSKKIKILWQTLNGVPKKKNKLTLVMKRKTASHEILSLTVFLHTLVTLLSSLCLSPLSFLKYISR